VVVRRRGPSAAAGDDLGVDDQVVAVLDAGLDEGLVLGEPTAALLVVERVAHRLAVGAGRRQVHLRDDVRQDPADRHAEGDDRLDRLGPRLVQERHLDPGGIRVSAVRHGQDTS
jgi:hypothetical protein